MATVLTGLTARLDVNLSVQAQKAVDLSTPTENLSISKSIALTYGIGALKSNQQWSDSAILVASANSGDIDLFGGLVAPLAPTVTFLHVKMIIIKNTSDALAVPTTSKIKIEAGTHAPDYMFTIPSLPAGGIVVIAAGDADGFLGTLTAGAKEDIKISNLDGGNSAQYSIVIIGEEPA